MIGIGYAFSRFYNSTLILFQGIGLFNRVTEDNIKRITEDNQERITE